MEDFSYLIDVQDLDSQGRAVAFGADDAQRRALAAALGLEALKKLEIRAQLSRRDDEAVIAKGTIDAEVVQSCVVTLEPVESVIEEAFEVCFVPRSASVSGGDEEVEVDPDAVDYELFDGVSIDLARTAVEYLALAIDPYPRRDGATFEQKSTDIADSSPFAALAKLRNNL